VGCILTEQLPFQTILGAYFVVVDFSLCGQWVWYRRNDVTADVVRDTSQSRGSVTISAGGETDPLLESGTRSHSVPRSVTSYTSSRTLQQHRHYRTIQALASNVAAAASEMSEATTTGEPDDEADMITSYYSERSARSRGKHVSWSQDRLGRDHAPTGRTVQEQEGDRQPSSSLSTSTRRSTAATGAGIVFLSFWAFLGVGYRIAPSSSLVASFSPSIGYVLPTAIPSPLYYQPSSVSVLHEPIYFIPPSERDGPITPQPPRPDVPPTYQRIIGRISAWICTTLYLTSRMPQIWKNFLRQSTQGLSPWLFLFAFLGNFFYVVSIMTSPEYTEASPREAKKFLMESLPYLLGSGGVLTFDLIILGQWWAFKGRKPRRSGTLGGSSLHGRGRRRSSSAARTPAGLPVEGRNAALVV